LTNTDICAPVISVFHTALKQHTHTITHKSTSSRRPGVHLLCVHLTSGCECFDVNPVGYVEWPTGAG